MSTAVAPHAQATDADADVFSTWTNPFAVPATRHVPDEVPTVHPGKFLAAGASDPGATGSGFATLTGTHDSIATPDDVFVTVTQGTTG